MTTRAKLYLRNTVVNPIIAVADIIKMPKSSPAIIHRVRRYPILIPNVRARVIHIPGVIETKKKVGMNMVSKAVFMNIDDYVIEELGLKDSAK